MIPWTFIALERSRTKDFQQNEKSKRWSIIWLNMYWTLLLEFVASLGVLYYFFLKFIITYEIRNKEVS